MVCSKCSQELKEGTKFCTKCGAEQQETVFCAKCVEKRNVNSTSKILAYLSLISFVVGVLSLVMSFRVAYHYQFLWALLFILFLSLGVMFALAALYGQKSKLALVLGLPSCVLFVSGPLLFYSWSLLFVLYPSLGVMFALGALYGQKSKLTLILGLTFCVLFVPGAILFFYNR